MCCGKNSSSATCGHGAGIVCMKEEIKRIKGKEKKIQKKKKKEEWENKRKRLDVFKCPPTKPTLHLSFSPSHQNHVPRIALLQAPKKSHLHHWSFKRTIFFTELCGLFGFLCLGQSLLTEKTGKREPSYPFTSSLFLGPLFSYFFLSLTFRSIFPHPSPHPTHLLLPLFLPLSL